MVKIRHGYGGTYIWRSHKKRVYNCVTTFKKSCFSNAFKMSQPGENSNRLPSISFGPHNFFFVLKCNFWNSHLKLALSWAGAPVDWWQYPRLLVCVNKQKWHASNGNETKTFSRIFFFNCVKTDLPSAQNWKKDWLADRRNKTDSRVVFSSL